MQFGFLKQKDKEWPFLKTKEELQNERTLEERRKRNLITGTNWPPRTFPKRGEGYFFFQGPTPKTAVQADLPSFFSAENFASMKIERNQVIVTITGFLSFFVIFAALISPTAKSPSPATLQVAPKAVEKPKLTLPTLPKLPKDDKPKSAEPAKKAAPTKEEKAKAAAEKAAAEKAGAEKAAAAKAAEKAEKEAAEKLKAEEAAKAAAEKAAAEKAAAEKAAAEKAAAERAAMKPEERAKLEARENAEKAAVEKAEKAAKAQAAAEKAAQQKALAAEKAEKAAAKDNKDLDAEDLRAILKTYSKSSATPGSGFKKL
jgi:flagellar biosynthesis GTPase FlhF